MIFIKKQGLCSTLSFYETFVFNDIDFRLNVGKQQMTEQ